MTAISRVVADKLFEVCTCAHETWMLHRTLFDDNRDIEQLAHGKHVYFFKHLNHVLQEYALLQIAKLHDPAVMSGRVNLSLAYIVDYGGWNAAIAGRLRALKTRLDDLDTQIRPARNRILSHNDLATLLDDRPLGAFPKDADVEYFQTLHEFVNCVFQEVTGSPCADFATFSRSDAQGLICALLASDAARLERPPIR
jgi:hypothetical protein